MVDAWFKKEEGSVWGPCAAFAGRAQAFVMRKAMTPAEFIQPASNVYCRESARVNAAARR